MRAYRLAWVLAAAIGGLLIGSGAKAASFDCRKASSVTEKAVCADPAVSRLDEEVASAYRAVQAYWPEGNWRAFLASEQRDWLRDRDRNCKADKACLERDYELRLMMLKKPEIKWMGRYVSGPCPKDGRYLDATPSHPAAEVGIELYLCPNPSGNMLLQVSGKPDAKGVLVVMEAGCRREFHFMQDAVSLTSTGGKVCRAFTDLDGTYRRDPAKSPWRQE